MSIEAMCSRDTIEIRRLDGSSDGAEGVPSKNWTVMARGSLPALDVKCRLQPSPPEEVVALGLRGERKPTRVYTSSNPHLGPEDHVIINGESYSVVVTQQDFDTQDRLYKSVVQRFTNAD